MIGSKIWNNKFNTKLNLVCESNLCLYWSPKGNWTKRYRKILIIGWLKTELESLFRYYIALLYFSLSENFPENNNFLLWLYLLEPFTFFFKPLNFFPLEHSNFNIISEFSEALRRLHSFSRYHFSFRIARFFRLFRVSISIFLFGFRYGRDVEYLGEFMF